MSHHLWEYPSLPIVESGHEGILERALNSGGGVLTLAHRFAGRSFCTPGRRLRLREEDLYPTCFGGTGLDELWMCCTTPIVTGTIDTRTGQAPFREGEAHVVTPEGMVALQELIELAPLSMIGARHEDFTRRVFGRPTWGIVSKKFDNKHPIPHHLHWSKWEVYDINRFDNPGVHPSHYYTTAMGLYPWVTKGEFRRCMERFGSPGGNDVRSLSPHVKVPVDQGGFCMPNGVLHSPTNLVHHEVHVLMDEHFLAEDLTQDGTISPEVAFLACREEDYPRDRHGDWEYLTYQKMNFEANQAPNFVRDNARPPLFEPNLSPEGVTAEWIVYGNLLGSQKCSILRLTLKPGASSNFIFRSPCVFHVNKGRGRVGKADFELAPEIRLGQVYNELGFITAHASDAGVNITNTGNEMFVLTLDFPQEAHMQTPGT